MAKVFTFQLVILAINAIHTIHTPFTHFALYAHLKDIHIVDLEIVGFDSFEEAPKLHCKSHLLIAAMLSICHLIHCLLGLKRAKVEIEVHVHENRHYISSQS